MITSCGCAPDIPLSSIVRPTGFGTDVFGIRVDFVGLCPNILCCNCCAETYFVPVSFRRSVIYALLTLNSRLSNNHIRWLIIHMTEAYTNRSVLANLDDPIMEHLPDYVMEWKFRIMMADHFFGGDLCMHVKRIINKLGDKEFGNFVSQPYIQISKNEHNQELFEYDDNTFLYKIRRPGHEERLKALNLSR